MRTAKRVSFLSPALALLAFWSIEAGAMMGTEGPPPCETQACFAEAISTCKAKASYLTGTAAGASAQYMIEGATEAGNCKLGMIYTRHPKPGWTYKPLHFVVNPDSDIESGLKDAVSDCLSGHAGGHHECSGPLLDISGAAGD